MQKRPASRNRLRARVVLTSVALLGAIYSAGTALAQTRDSTVAQPALGLASEQASAEPTWDEGTAQRIAAAILKYSAIQALGGWPLLPEDAKLMSGASGEQVALLRRRLAITGDLRADQQTGQVHNEVHDEALAAALRHFQMRHGLAESGVVDAKTLTALNVPVNQRLNQLSASLDRLAAMDFTFGQRYVIVNLPAASAEAVEGDKVVRRYSVRIGNSNRPSPTLTTQIAAVNLNPAWSVPLAITKSALIPQIRKDAGYLARMHMRVLDGNGAERDPRTVSWNSIRTPNFTVRQDPGGWNALGRLRVTMPNLQAVFMHELNPGELPDRGYDIESSGCIALPEMRDFASWLLRDAPGWGGAEIEAAIATGDQVDVRLPHKVPVAWVYLTGWVTRGGLIQFRDDIYSRDRPASRPLLADNQRPDILTGARASGAFALQSAEQTPAQPPTEIEETSYLDRQ